MSGCHVQPEQMFNLIWGYNAPYLEQVEELNAPGANSFLYGTEVPLDEVWVVSGLSGMNSNKNPITITGGIYDGASWYGFFSGVTAVNGQVIFCQVPLVVGPGKRVYALLQNCTVGNNIYLNASGYKMKLTQ